MLCLNLDVGCLTLCAAEGLMDHDFTVRQCQTLALCTCGEKECTHGCCHAHTDGGNVALDEIHGVVNCHACGNGSAGAVDVEGDVLVGIFRFQEQKLSHNEGCGYVVYFVCEKYDSVVEKAGIDVIGSFAAVGLLYDHGYQCHNVPP